MYLPLRVFAVQWGIPQNSARIIRGFHHGAETLAKRYALKRSISGQHSRALGSGPQAVDTA
jgi:hypothetical protein